MVDLTFHVHWQIIFQFRHQPLRRGSFVCLGSNRSLANRADAAVEVVLRKLGPEMVLPKFGSRPICCPSLYHPRFASAMKRRQTSRLSAHDAALYWGGSRFSRSQ